MSKSDHQIIYEHPLNERTRSLLRLEHLFTQTEFHLPLPGVWHSRAAIDGLLGVTNIFLRSDLKGDLIKGVDRYRKALGRIEDSHSVDSGRLDEILDKLGALYSRLQASTGSPGQKMRRNEFLMDIMQRSSIPGGNCAFDLPYYHYWLQKPALERRAQLQEWLDVYGDFREAVLIILSLIRDSTASTEEHAADGFFQQNLDPQSPTQLIRVFLPESATCFPEISGGRHRFTIRFMGAEGAARPVQVKEDIDFHLSRCVF